MNLDVKSDENLEFYEQLFKLPYSNFFNLFVVQQNNTPFSTKHNTKGDEYENVIVVIDDSSWKARYNFEDFFAENYENEKKTSNTSNLLYVVSSRAKHNLCFLFLSPLSDKSIKNVKNLFGKENFIQI